MLAYMSVYVNTTAAALALVRLACQYGMQEKYLMAALKDTGMYPWNPNVILVDQHQSLFKNKIADSSASGCFSSAMSRSVLHLPLWFQCKRCEM